MTDNEIRLGQEVGRLQEQNKLLQLMNLQLIAQNEKMKCCANCKHFNKLYQINDICDSCFGYDKWELKE